jgi:hypothetical protein
MLSGRVFQHAVVIPMCANCDPVFTDLFHYLYEANFIQELLSDEKREEASSIL